MVVKRRVLLALCALISTALGSFGVSNAATTAPPSAVDWRLFIIPAVALIAIVGYALSELYKLVRGHVKKKRRPAECGICI